MTKRDYLTAGGLAVFCFFTLFSLHMAHARHRSGRIQLRAYRY